MRKRITALLLCFVLLIAALPIQASAASADEVQRICDQITNIYWQSLSSAGLGTFHGYCGTMVGWELYHLGITDKAITHNGNEMYDLLKTSDHICEGYNPEYYPASMYSIEEALNTITGGGQKDAYNIMVGFSWTTTAAGSMYGHANVIHAILDGMVYFTEGFMTPFQTDPSQPMVCTIAEFADYFDSWASFEGLIHFGASNGVDGCETHGSNFFATATKDVPLLLTPDAIEAEEGRTVTAGERLHVTAVCINEHDERFYQVKEDDQYFYIPTTTAEPFLFLYNDLTYTDIALPEHLEVGKDFKLSGVIRSKNCRILNAVVQICDENGGIVLSYEMLKDSYMLDLGTKSINTRVDLKLLSEGRYTIEVYCDMVNFYDDNGLLVGDMQRSLVASSEFTVGNVEPNVATRSIGDIEIKTGWQYENGSWYYYEDGTAKTGWLRENGINYYLQDDGTAATGWTNINGKNRYFSETGAMRTGWLITENDSFYLLRNGVPAAGWFEIDGVLRFFTEDGRLVTDAVRNYENIAYIIDETGIATVME